MMNKTFIGFCNDGLMSTALLKQLRLLALSLLATICLTQDARAVQTHEDDSSNPTIHLAFDDDIGANNASIPVGSNGVPSFVPGLRDQAIAFGNDEHATLTLPVAEQHLDDDHDFSVMFWIRTTASSDEKGVLLSTKELKGYDLNSQKQKGWAFLVSHGTWGWNMGSGKRRITYERTNGEYFRLNDGRWHQLAMTHEASKGLIRLYFDGKNLVTYNVKDSGSFEFGNRNALTVAWNGEVDSRAVEELPAFVNGAKRLQEMVDEFNRIGLPEVDSSEFEMLVSRPSRLLERKIENLVQQGKQADKELLEAARAFDIGKIEAMSKRLMQNPYTVHQSSYYNEVSLLFKLYRLKAGRISLDARTARRLAKREILSRPSFDMDELQIWNRLISPEEVLESYGEFFQTKIGVQSEKLESLVAGSWNIYHGGLHHSIERDGFDSRQAIIDLLKREKIDVLMMQETYSSGDYIAAELGYYLSTTIDWDNMNQGANISVLSKYPIREVYVPPKSTFMSVGTKVSLSETQDLYVMSAWFGMRNFEDVFNFHKKRFDESDSIPTLFAGDFNAVPHTDGGVSPASKKLKGYGFTDAYRSLYPDVQKFPGHTHRSDRRIDQLYFKGNGLKNTATEVHSQWPSKFPSDHYLLKSVFELDYSTRQNESGVSQGENRPEGVQSEPASDLGGRRDLTGDDWELLWQDEFDEAELDDTKWSLCKRGTSAWRNTMSADPRLLEIGDGILHLRGIVNDDQTRDRAPFLTAGVTSKNKFSFQYGKVKIRARFKSAQGAWPALWMLGTRKGWEGKGEIDLMEHLNFDDEVYQTVHSFYTLNIDKTNTPMRYVKAAIQKDDWNTYGCEWDKDRIVFTVNGEATHTYPRMPSKGEKQWSFDQPFYLILSMQIGGNWVNDSGPTNPDHYPAGMEIDWVRVYRQVAN